MRLKKLRLVWSHMGSVWQEDSGLRVPAFYLTAQTTHIPSPFKACCTSGIQWKHAGITPSDHLGFCSLEQRDFSQLLSRGIRILKRSERDVREGEKSQQVTALSALGMFCLCCCQWSWCAIRSNLKHFSMCFCIKHGQDCANNAIIKERTWLTRKLDRWANKSLVYWIYVISLSFCMWPAFPTTSYYQNAVTTAAAISFTSSEESDNPSASSSPVVWVRGINGQLKRVVPNRAEQKAVCTSREVEEKETNL